MDWHEASKTLSDAVRESAGPDSESVPLAEQVDSAGASGSALEAGAPLVIINRRASFSSQQEFSELAVSLGGRGVQWLATIFEAGATLLQPGPPEALLIRLLEIVRVASKADRVLLRINAGHDSVLSLLSQRWGAEDLAVGGGGLQDDASKDATDLALETGEVLSLRVLEPGVLGEQAVCAAVPLMSRDVVVGVLQVERTGEVEPWTVEHLSLLAGLGLYVGVVFERASQQVPNLESRGIEAELRDAEKIQEFFLPKNIPDVPGVEIQWRAFLSHGLGGDYYDLLELEDGRVAIVLGDVSGHSISSALVLSSVRALIRRNCLAALDPADALEATNDIVKPELPPGMFVTLFLGMFDPATYTLTYSNAGHNNPLLFRASDGSVSELQTGGLPIGVLRGSSYEDDAVQLNDQDALLLYTDALVEAKDAGGRPFSVAAVRMLFEKLARNSAEHIVEAISQRVLGYHLSGPLPDDLTLLSLRVNHVRRNHRFRFPSVPSEVAPAAERVARMARDMGFVGPGGEAKLRLSLVELIANAVEHGNRYDPATGVTVSVSASPDDLLVRVRDEGPGFDAERVINRIRSMQDLVHPRGRGLIIVREMVGSPKFNARGNEVTLVIDRKQLSH